MGFARCFWVRVARPLLVRRRRARPRARWYGSAHGPRSRSGVWAFSDERGMRPHVTTKTTTRPFAKGGSPEIPKTQRDRWGITPSRPVQETPVSRASIDGQRFALAAAKLMTNGQRATDRSAAAASLSLAKKKMCDDGQIGRVRRLLLVGKLGAVNFILTWSRICRGELVALDGVNVRTRITVPFFLGKSKDLENFFKK